MTDTQKTAHYQIIIQGTVANHQTAREQLRVFCEESTVKARYLYGDPVFRPEGSSPATVTATANFTGWNGAEFNFTDADVPPTRHDQQHPGGALDTQGEPA